MPAWTLRLIACAGLVVLLSRLPAPASLPDAFVLSAACAALVLSTRYGALLNRTLHAHLHSLLSLVPGSSPIHHGRLHPAHGADA